MVVIAVVAAIAGVAMRFAIPSPLWLDEALSVNIASLPVGEIADALRRDGHPPLYYLLLHGWIAAFGDGADAVRALSGLFGLVAMGLAWVVGRRRGGPTVAWLLLALVATSPFALRYATETRMYALVMVEVLLGILLLDVVHRRAERAEPTLIPLVGVALVAAALLWTHYWAMWLLAGVGLRELWVAWRGTELQRRAARGVVLALFGGGLLFVPWLPSLLEQAAHTGTPWAPPSRPTDIVAVTVSDVGGGGYRDAQSVGWFLVVLALLGIFGRAVDPRRIELDLRTVPGTRPEAAVLGLTVVVGSSISYVTGAAYASRYAAVLVPIFLLLVAAGLSRFRSAAVLSVLTVVAVVGGLFGGLQNLLTDRTQLGQIADAVDERAGDGDLVVYCPDQLGPAGNRVMPDRVEQLVYPTMDGPELVDWVDYQERNEAADPAAFADELLARAGDHRIFLVWNPAYRTFEGQCQELFLALAEERFALTLVEANGGEYFENANLTVFRAP